MKMKRANSESSGDEFFDAVEHLEEDSNCESDEISESGEEYVRLQSLRESNLEEEESQSESDQPTTPAQQPRQALQEELWVSAKEFAKNSSEDSFDYFNARSQSLLDTVLDTAQTESTSYEVIDEQQINSQLDNNNYNDNSENEIETEDSTGNNDTTAAPVKRIVPPLHMESLHARNRSLPAEEIEQIFTVSTKEMEEVIEKEFDEGDMQTLNRLVDKLQAAENTKQSQEDDSSTKEEERKIDDEGAVIDHNESVQNDSPEQEQYLTPQKIIDCSHVTDMVCDIKSPLEALYLFCPRPSTKSIQGGSHNGDSNYDTTASPPTRTSISNDEDIFREVPPPPLSESTDTETENIDVRPMNLESDSSDDDSSTTSGDKYQMINKDTGQVHDLRNVMKEIDQVGSSDALDTGYSFLPTKDQLEFQHKSSLKVGSKESDESGTEAPGIPLADSGVTEDSSPKTAARKRGIKFSKITTSKMAADIRKGVAGLKTSRQQKLNRKRTSSADMLPSNAIHVKSKQRQNRSMAAGFSEHSQGDVQADSSFNPMLLIKTLPNAHSGPAWCSSFSKNGRFLATGGEDGMVCIWAVSPKSKAMHPNGVSTQQKQQGGSPILHKSGTDDTDNVECVAKEEDSEKEASSAPPLHFIGTGPELATNLKILSSEPIQRFKDHTADVIDLSWSHTNFLLSASLDSSVRLYHFSKPGCLHLFKHANLVASVDFHPRDDRYFISGGIDKKLRLWDITDGRVKEWAQAPDVITACRFTPDGKYATAGLFRGQVYFYDVNGLKYYTQIACRNRSGKHRMGKKVTGISFVRGERDDWVSKENSVREEHEETSNSERSVDHTVKGMARRVTSRFRSSRPEALRYTERMLVTTNDSRVRLYGLNDFCLVRKYKGHRNYSMQIRARISESGNHIASGSESGHVFIWDTLDKNRPKKSNVAMKAHQTHDKTKSSDHFEASKAPLPIVTDSVFFPSKSMYEALRSSEKVFPFSLGMDRVDEDMSSAAILTLDYDGTMRVFLRKTCIDNILDAATPRGGTMT